MTKSYTPSPALDKAVFRLSEQAKNKELAGLKELSVASKLSPIEPVLGLEIKPDRIDQK